MKIGQVALSALVGVPIALLYALLVRLTFAADEFSLFLGTMTCGFLFLVPLAIGALTVRFAPIELRRSLAYVIVGPWISIFIVAIGSAALYLEAAICIMMAVPLFMVFASVGGIWFHSKNTNINKPSQNTMLGIILLAPYIVTPLEMRIPDYNSYRSVESQVVINAPISEVWENIITIPRINPEEQDVSAFHLFGVPKLLEAPLSHQGVGGTRNVRFDNGLSFIETITSWDEFNNVSFSIGPNEDSPAPAPFNMVGGKYFAVTEMTYWIEETSNGSVILRLHSQHRLTTHFNSYAGIWTDLMLGSLQSYVLRMIKTRAENLSP